MRNRIIKIACILCVYFPIGSCTNYLDVVPDNIAEIDNAFESREGAIRFLASIYNQLPPYASINNPALVAGDEISVNENVSRNWAGKVIARGGQGIVTPLLGYWGNQGTVRNLFIALRDCNIFLENLDKPYNLTETERIRWEAEAKFLKAYFHFYLMRMYGPIPLVRENIDVSSGVDEVRVSREPVDEVVTYIVELLDEAIPNLPLEVEDRGLELGRVTAPVAAAIKARVLVTAASPMFNGNPDYSGFVDKQDRQLISSTFDESKWAIAATACKEAIDLAHSAGHFLYSFQNPLPSWSERTVQKLTLRGSISERWNEEIIWGGTNSPVANELQNWSMAKIAPGLSAENRESTQSWWSPPLHIAEMFYSENGVPIEEDMDYDYGNRYKVAVADESHQHYVRVGFSTAKLNLDREPRFYAYLGFDGGVWEGHGVTDDNNALVVAGKFGQQAGRLDANRWSESGYWAKKLVYYENVQSVTQSSYSVRAYPFPIVRLADLYLLYAEALNESNGPGSAYEWIDQVRVRAGLKGVVESWASFSNLPEKPLSQDGLREIIQTERLIELSFEGQRFWDLRRWKMAVEYLNRDILGWNVEGETTDSYYNVVSNGSTRFLSRDYLWPISETDLINNNNLIQNPGW